MAPPGADLPAEIVGIARYRRFARPSTRTHGLWSDDPFTSSAHRGRGIGRALIARVRTIAAADGGSVVRWITAADNTTARALYDTAATPTHWVTYDLVP